MKKNKLLLFMPLVLLSLAGLAACDFENVKKVGGNEMAEGSRTYNYAYVCSQVTGKKYYHISGWKEFEPTSGSYSNYSGLELQLATSKDVVYYWEPNLMYTLTKEYNADYGTAIE